MSDEFKALKLLTPEQLDYVGYQGISLNPGAFLCPYILGLFLDTLLLGVLLTQVSRWFTYCFHRERLQVKLLVFYCVLVNMAITVFLIVWNFQMFSAGFGRYRQFLSIDWASNYYLIDALIRFPVSSFFAHRAYLASMKSKIIGGILCLLLAASFTLGVAAKFVAVDYYGTNLFITLSCVWLSCHLACDLLTTSTIAIYLYRSKTGWSQTDALMIQLLVMTAETQLPPTLLSLAFLIVYVANTASAWPILFVFSAKVFAICLIAVLNTKFTLRRELENSSSVGGNNTYSLKVRGNKPQMQVHVTTETYHARDEGILSTTGAPRIRGHGNELASVTVDGRKGNEGFRGMPDLEDGEFHQISQVRFDRD